MKVIVLDCEPNPTRVRAMLEALPGLGTATVSGKTPNRPLQPLKETGWREISDETLPRAASEHQDIWYRVSLQGKNRRHIVYARDPVVLVI